MAMDQEVMREVAQTMVDLTALLVQAVEAEDSEAAFIALMAFGRITSEEAIEKAITLAVHGYDVNGAILATLRTAMRLVSGGDDDDTVGQVLEAGRRFDRIAQSAVERFQATQ